MPGVKNASRLRSYMTDIALYRNVTVDDGAVNPAAPPDVAKLDLSGSPQALNTVQLFITPDSGGADPVLEVWGVNGTEWYYINTKTVPAATPQVWTLENVPAIEIAVIAVAAGDGVSIKASMSA